MHCLTSLLTGFPHSSNFINDFDIKFLKTTIFPADKSNEERLSSSSGSKPSMKWKSSSSSSSSNFSSDSDSSSYVNNSSLDPRLCPPDCSQDAYDRACEMRDKRLGVREALLESKAARDRYFHDVGELKEKLDVLEGSSKTAGKDLEVFQVGKEIADIESPHIFGLLSL